VNQTIGALALRPELYAQVRDGVIWFDDQPFAMTGDDYSAEAEDMAKLLAVTEGRIEVYQRDRRVGIKLIPHKERGKAKTLPCRRRRKELR